MNFLRLPDPLFTILFEDDDIVAMDKPYGINTHTNDSKIENSDLIQDGLIEMLEKQLGRKLHIVHRLDQTTTGVIIFAKSQESAKKYAEYFFDRLVKKTYQFVTAGVSERETFSIDHDILQKGKELTAQTDFTRLKKSARFELWEARPHTGRNHQIRIHAQIGGLPLLGDVKYDGAPYPFLCLHNRKIEFPNGVTIESRVPGYFDDLSLLEDRQLARTFFESDRRERLFRASQLSDQCVRLVHNKNDAQDLGYTLDQFGSCLVLSWYSEIWQDSDQRRFQKFADFYARPIIVRLMHNRGKDPVNKSQIFIAPHSLGADGPSKPAATPMPTTWIARENELDFEFRSDSGQSFGLFLDQRLQRRWVKENTSGRTVLNLFSYTCGFSAVAAHAGAALVTSVDTNKNVLNWGKRNFELNDLALDAHRFFCRDSLTFLDQCVNKGTKFDLVICDPPSFSRGDKGVFKIETSLEALLSKCLQCLTENGDLLFSTNSENLFIDDIRKAIVKVAQALRLAPPEINCIQSALDFELPEKRAILKSFLIRKR